MTLKACRRSPGVPVQAGVVPQQVLSRPKLDLKCQEAFPELGSKKEASPALSRKKEEEGERAGGGQEEGGGGTAAGGGVGGGYNCEGEGGGGGGGGGSGRRRVARTSSVFEKKNNISREVGWRGDRKRPDKHDIYPLSSSSSSCSSPPQCTLASTFCQTQSTLVSAHSGSPVSPHYTTPISPHSYTFTGASGVLTPNNSPRADGGRTASRWSEGPCHIIIRAVRKDDESERRIDHEMRRDRRGDESESEKLQEKKTPKS